MKLRRVTVNLRKKQLELVTRTGVVYPMPFSKLEEKPSRKDPIVDIYVDPELGNEAVTYTLASGKEGGVHIDHALDYNCDPAYCAGITLHLLTCDALQRLKTSGLSLREVARRLKTSVPQVYRLLDTANYSKSFTQMMALFQVLDCDVEFVVKPRRVRGRAASRTKTKAAQCRAA